MRTQRQRRRFFGTTVALATGVALTLGAAGPVPAVTPSAGAGTGTGSGAGFGTGTGSESGSGSGAGARTVTLLTGDRVRIDTAGRVIGVDRPEGRKHIPVRITRHANRTHVVPLDAERLIAAGKLDRNLFDITALSRPEARTAYADGLKVIVTYAGPSAAAAKAGVRGSEGTAVRRSLPTLNAEALTASPDEPTALWDALTASGSTASRTTAVAGIGKVWLDGVVKAALDRTTKQIGAPTAWNRGLDGTGVTIAVLDTGVDDTHPDLAGKVRAAANFSNSPGLPDRVGHGTHVAATAAGTGAKSGGTHKGVAPGATLLNGKVLNDWGIGSESTIMAGIEWAAAQGADIVNLSVGGPDRIGTGPSEAQINRLSEQKGILFAVAAGNAGPGDGTIDSPGSAEAALTAGAVDGNDVIADFSGRGPKFGDSGIKPDVTAPGVAVVAAAADGTGPQNPPGYYAMSGTSMATPHAAGAAALLKQQHPDWTGSRLKAALMGSAKPGAYSPHVQGAGRIAVDRAVEQGLFAEPGSLSLGSQAWPHEDDTPVTKRLTYHNTGPEDVTLNLAVTGATGPGGQPAPDGFFTLGASSVTVPGRGTATVDVTADTRIAAGGNGGYAATVTATNGGLSVRTPVAVDREDEAYSVTIRNLDRSGKPDPYALVSVAALTGAAQGRTFEGDWSSGTATLRLPKGRYFVDHVTQVDGDLRKGSDQVLYPNLDIAGDTTVVLDARTAKPSRITVPDPESKPVSTVSYWGLETQGYSGGFIADPPGQLRTAHAGPPAPAGDKAWQGWIGMWQGGAADRNTVHYAQSSRFSALTKDYRASDFAKLSVGLGSAVKGRTGRVAVIGVLPTGEGIGVWVERPAPSRHEAAVAGNTGTAWNLNYDQLEKPGDAAGDVYFYSADRVYTAGKSYRVDINTAVHGPRVAGRFIGVFRDGDSVIGQLPFFSDGSGHIGDSRYSTARTTLRKGGKLIDEKADDLVSDEPLTLPGTPGKYTLTTTVTRPVSVSAVGTRIEGTWTFATARAPEPVRLPLSTIRFSPAVALDSTAPAGRTQTFPVAVEGAAAGTNLRSLAVHVSYDSGKTWRQVPVKKGTVTLKNPGKGKGLALRGQALDKQGNRSVVTVHQAYLGR